MSLSCLRVCVCVCVCVIAGGGMGSMSMDRMGSGFDRMGMSGMDMNRGFGGYGGGGHMGGGMSDRGSGSKGGCQIFVRNVSVRWICDSYASIENWKHIKLDCSDRAT